MLFVLLSCPSSISPPSSVQLFSSVIFFLSFLSPLSVPPCPPSFCIAKGLFSLRLAWFFKSKRHAASCALSQPWYRYQTISFPPVQLPATVQAVDLPFSAFPSASTRYQTRTDAAPWPAALPHTPPPLARRSASTRFPLSLPAATQFWHHKLLGYSFLQAGQFPLLIAKRLRKHRSPRPQPLFRQPLFSSPQPIPSRRLVNTIARIPTPGIVSVGRLIFWAPRKTASSGQFARHPSIVSTRLRLPSTRARPICALDRGPRNINY